MLICNDQFEAVTIRDFIDELYRRATGVGFPRRIDIPGQDPLFVLHRANMSDTFTAGPDAGKCALGWDGYTDAFFNAEVLNGTVGDVMSPEWQARVDYLRAHQRDIVPEDFEVLEGMAKKLAVHQVAFRALAAQRAAA